MSVPIRVLWTIYLWKYIAMFTLKLSSCANLQERTLNMAEKTNYLLFMINAFQVLTICITCWCSIFQMLSNSCSTSNHCILNDIGPNIVMIRNFFILLIYVPLIFMTISWIALVIILRLSVEGLLLCVLFNQIVIQRQLFENLILTMVMFCCRVWRMSFSGKLYFS